MHRTPQKCHCEPVTDVTGVAIRSFLCTAPLVTRGNGFPRRCAPRNDIFHGDHLALRRDGAEPPLRTLYKFLCRAAPMCAAARHALHPQRRGTLAPPYRRFTNSVGDDAHIVPNASHQQPCARRGRRPRRPARRTPQKCHCEPAHAGVAIRPSFRPFAQK